MAAPVTCATCDQKDNLTSFCVDCGQQYCGACAEPHTFLKAFRDHVTIDLDTGAVTNLRGHIDCEGCRTKTVASPAVVFCSDCPEPQCEKCNSFHSRHMVTKHHKVIKISQGNDAEKSLKQLSLSQQAKSSTSEDTESLLASDFEGTLYVTPPDESSKMAQVPVPQHSNSAQDESSKMAQVPVPQPLLSSNSNEDVVDSQSLNGPKMASVDDQTVSQSHDEVTGNLDTDDMQSSGVSEKDVVGSPTPTMESIKQTMFDREFTEKLDTNDPEATGNPKKDAVDLPALPEIESVHHMMHYSEFSVALETDDKSCDVVSILCLPDGRVLVLDANNQQLKVYDKEYDYLYSFFFPRQAFDVTSVSHDTVVVACFRELHYAQLQHNGGRILDKQFPINGCPLAVSHASGTLAILCNDPYRVLIVDNDNVIRNDVKLTQGDLPFFVVLDDSASSFYVCDKTKSLVQKYSCSNANILWTCRIFAQPNSIIPTMNELLIVCDQKILVMSDNGVYLRDIHIMGRDFDMFCPCADVQKRERRIVVGSSLSDKVQIYNI